MYKTAPIQENQLKYFNREIEIHEEVILDHGMKGNDIMMEWEREIMRDASELICQNGGDILNVGFGMGIIDTYIEEHRPRTHWIIEAHPDIQKKMIAEGWLQKPHVRCIFKPWQEVIYHLPKFDGIYFDTWDDHQQNFDRNVHNILKENGIFSFFNNPDQSPRYRQEENFFLKEEHSEILEQNCNIDFLHKTIETNIPEGLDYWDHLNKNYHHPICTRK
jgi:protein arginine N-methyltransferase 2